MSLDEAELEDKLAALTTKTSLGSSRHRKATLD